MHCREIGRKNARGIISFGIFKILIIGDIRLIKKSIIPELLNAPIATKRPINVGNKAITIPIPSFAPSKNVSNTLIFSFKPKITIIVITIGIIELDIKLI
mgnify:FL=1